MPPKPKNETDGDPTTLCGGRCVRGSDPEAAHFRYEKRLPHIREGNDGNSRIEIGKTSPKKCLLTAFL